MEEESVDINDHFRFGKYRVHYTVHNPGAPTKTGILLLHGRYTHSGYWPLLFGNQDRYTLFSYDCPGQGRSSGRRGGFDLFRLAPALCAAFVSDIVGKYNIHSLYVLGESAGALVAFYSIMEQKLSANVRGLIFMLGVYSIPQLERTRDLLFLFVLNILVPWLRLLNKKPFTDYTKNERLLLMLREDRYYCRYSSIRYIAGVHRFVKYLNSRISDCSVPLLHGRYDRYSDPIHVREFYNRIAKKIPKKMAVFENSSHWLTVSDDVSEMRSCLFDWIEEREGISA